MRTLFSSVAIALFLCTLSSAWAQSPPVKTSCPPAGKTPPAPGDYAPGRCDAPSIPPTYLNSPLYKLDEVCASYIAELIAAKEYAYEKLQQAQPGLQFTREDFERCDANHYLARYRSPANNTRPVVYLICPANTDGTEQAKYSVGNPIVVSATIIEFADTIRKKLELVRAMPYRLAPECIRKGDVPPGRQKP